jgi:rod shape-determining protein MreC
MDLILNRYRNLTALVAAILVQLVLLAYQVKSNQEIRLIRVWAVTAVTPLARLLEGSRSGTVNFFKDYFVLLDQNKRLQTDLNRVQLENQVLRSELDTAERGKALSVFQEQSQMKTVAARIIGNSPGSNGRVVLIDRGTGSGIQPGMAVITPDGIVGKIVSSYPTASNLLLITDPTFAAGVLSQKNRVHGTLKGTGNSNVIVDYVQNEQTVEVGEWFYTAGDDRIFPKGLLAGTVTAVRPGRTVKEIFLNPSGLQHGLEDVLVILEGDHKPIPDLPPANQSVHLQPLPPAEGDPANPLNTAHNASTNNGGAETDLDREVERTRRIGEDQKHVFGERGRGAPDFNRVPDPAATHPAPAAPPPAKPAAAVPPPASATPSAIPSATPSANQPRP